MPDPSEPGAPGNDERRYDESAPADDGRCHHSLEQWSREYLRETAREQGHDPESEAVDDWIDSEASHMAEHLSSAVSGYMSDGVDPIPEDE